MIHTLFSKAKELLTSTLANIKLPSMAFFGPTFFEILVSPFSSTACSQVTPVLVQEYFQDLLFLFLTTVDKVAEKVRPCNHTKYEKTLLCLFLFLNIYNEWTRCCPPVQDSFVLKQLQLLVFQSSS